MRRKTVANDTPLRRYVDTVLAGYASIFLCRAERIMKTERHAFIVRIWNEVMEIGPRTVWRGSVMHVSSAKQIHFTDLDGMVRFIQEQAGMQSKRNLPWFLTWLFEGYREVARKWASRH